MNDKLVIKYLYYQGLLFHKQWFTFQVIDDEG